MLLAVLLVLADASPEPTASPACAGADPAITSISSELIKRRSAPDHYVITTTLTNVAAQNQTPDITQHVELVRDGSALAPQTVPALGAGVAYTLAFAVYRPSAERSKPLTVTVRYVLDSGDAVRNACNRANDELTKTF